MVAEIMLLVASTANIILAVILWGKIREVERLRFLLQIIVNDQCKMEKCK